MKLKFEHDNIVNLTNNKVYNVNDTTDMKILCHDVNEVLSDLESRLDYNKKIVNGVKKVLREGV